MTISRPLIQGSLVALATPMTVDNQLDWDALKVLVQFHLDNGTDALVATGTTGESATLSVDEHLKVVGEVIKQVNGRIPVIAGTGSNSTMEALKLTQQAADLGADACLLVVPYYNKPTQEGLYRHFSHIADTVNVAQILYNVPGRTMTDMSNETVLRLAGHKNIVGIKDATGDPDRGEALIQQLPDDFAVYSGDDITAYELMLRGAKGNISVTANIVPQLMSQLCVLALDGQRDEAEALQQRLMPLHQSLFLEANPIPVKWALNHMGLIPPGIRLPLTPLSERCQVPLSDAMMSLGLV
ncbi:4-hydroxy-tetrahydrodipicolinate synthase [Candidatus Endobugula sertula]|uniref:4-hydroxy-tetrahydrodipicolinate synthase n=1 Tax=Candidatus Endobugula sertula TaxID=62101 RepID=A0A1D2QNB2_9GAMM|nr:4-hydroxy-tetrahydrodipicolinate synthase [Candidatus Endobugula sertula]